jgi:hypothetical protein
VAITPRLVIGRSGTPHLRAPDSRCPFAVVEVELLGGGTRLALTKNFLEIWVDTVDSGLNPIGILRIVGRILGIDLRNCTSVARAGTTLVTLLVARVPLPREVE